MTTEALNKAIDAVGQMTEEVRSLGKKVEDLENEKRSTADTVQQLTEANVDLDKALKARESEDAKLAETRAQEKADHDKELESFRAEIEELARKSISPAQGGGKTKDQEEYSRAWDQFMRRGVETGLSELQQRATNTIADPDGGYAVPEEVDRNILELERGINVMRDVSSQMTVSTPDYKKLVNLGGAASGWVGETDARPETGTPTLAQLPAYMGEIYANPAATQTSLDDMFFDAEAWIAQEVAIEFAEQENLAFTSGNGTNKALGLFAAPRAQTTDKAGTRPFGTFEERPTGAANAIAPDELIDLIHSLRRGHRARGRWMMENITIQRIRTMKDADNNYLWRPGLIEGQPNTLLGYTIEENEQMDDVQSGVSGSPVVAFGDFARAYMVVDRIGTRVLRDPYTNKPYVHFYTTKRVGGMPVDSNAVKFLSLQ